MLIRPTTSLAAHGRWSIRALARSASIAAAIGLGACAARPGTVQNSAVQAEPVSLAPVFIAPADAAQAVEMGALLLDARPSHEFLLSHAQGAVNIHWDEFSNPDELGRLHADIDIIAERLGANGVSAGRAIVVIGGWDAHWGEEARVYWMLRHLGVAELAIVEGGHAAWRDGGLPTSRGVSRAETAVFIPEIDPSIVAEISSIGEFDVILDVRTREEFDGAVLHGEARGGHIPGAKHLHWTDLIAADGTLRESDEVRELVGVGTDNSVVTYCTGGVRSAFVWAALEHAGYSHVANYAGSWWEYAGSEEPVD